jgi:DNA-binding FadR family transcriptional regulator
MIEITPTEVRKSLGRYLTYGMLDAVGRAIVTGQYDGKRFPTEAELATQYSVSRPVTRGALKMLTAKGLLSARPRKGTIIQPESAWNLFDTDVLRWLLDRQFSLPLLRNFNELCIAVEPMAAQLAALHATPSGVAMIAAAYARMEAAERGDDDALEANIVFRVAILRACGNPFFVQFEDLVSTALRTSIRFTTRLQDRNPGLAVHKSVLEAIMARDPEVASATLRLIIENVMILIRNAESEGSVVDRVGALQGGVASHLCRP